MTLYEPLGKTGIIDEVNRLCNTTNDVYKNRDKIARINEGLDQYWFLAAEAAPQGTFDDTGNTSAPIETQNITAGTNAYKVTDFTNKVLQVLRVTVLNDDAEEEDLIYQDFEDIDEFLEEYSTDADDRGQPQYWTKIGDYIYIAPAPDYTETNGLRCYVNRELSKFSYNTFTVTIATPGVATDTSHGLVDNDSILAITDGALPTGLTAESTIYYIDQQTANTWQFCTTLSDVGSTYVNTTGSQSGTHQWVKANAEPGIPLIHHDYLARYAAYKFMKPDHPNFAKTREDLAIDTRDIQDYWQSTIRPGKTIIETKKRPFK